MISPKSSPMSDITGAARTVETLIHSTGDEISPIFAGGSYIGANHGWAAGPRLAMAAHGKTLADVGSRWSDGTSTYTLLKVLDANTLVLGGPYTVSAGRATVSITLPSGPLTHVSGATNTATITGTSVLEQIGPVSHTRSVVARIDGLPIRDGYSTGRELTIAVIGTGSTARALETRRDDRDTNKIHQYPRTALTRASKRFLNRIQRNAKSDS